MTRTRKYSAGLPLAATSFAYELDLIGITHSILAILKGI
jgi:hypothetical protein